MLAKGRDGHYHHPSSNHGRRVRADNGREGFALSTAGTTIATEPAVGTAVPSIAATTSTATRRLGPRQVRLLSDRG
jgi:hypothetical protein